MGAYLPFARTRAERDARHDPRPSLEERYASRDEYLQRIRSAATDLVRGGYLLADDVENVVARATRHWQYATQAKDSAQVRRCGGFIRFSERRERRSRSC